MVYQTPYLWHFEPPALGILTPLPMEYQTPSYLELLVRYHCYGILTPPMAY
jgi:hypothetical protein